MTRKFMMPPVIITGKDAVYKAGEYLKKMGRKALLVTDSFMVKTQSIQSFTHNLLNLGISFEIFSGITGEPTDDMVNEGYCIYKGTDCDFLIAFGGGSAMDTMKAIAILATYGGNIQDYMGMCIQRVLPPMAAIPTTSGTGSEATQFTIITAKESQVKMLLKGEALMPTLTVIDPYLSLTMPSQITAATGIDALTHAIEAYTSKKAQTLSDTFALSAVRRIFINLPIAFRDGTNLKAREEMAIAALEAGIAFNNASVTLIHGMSRPIGALFHIPHGMSNAMLINECLEFMVDGTYKRFARMAVEIGVAKQSKGEQDGAKLFLDAVKTLCCELEVPTLRQYGITSNEYLQRIPKMAKDAIESGSPDNTRKKVNKNDIETIYRNLWKD